MFGPLWTVVLAGGEGRRLAGVTGGVPKQFWRPGGTLSLLDRTLARVGPLTSPERTVIVVGPTQGAFVRGRSLQARGRTLVQPADRGTAFAVPFGLTCDDVRNPIVLVTPSDHGIVDASQFRRDVLLAAAAIEAGSAEIVLFGAMPLAATSDYGWLTLRGSAHGGRDHRLREVTAFAEKPARAEAERLYATGAVWNTFAFVARERALVDLYAKRLPDLALAFNRYRAAPVGARAALLRAAHEAIGPADFSRDVLYDPRGIDAITWSHSLGWTDLGTPDRLGTWQRQGAVDVSRRLPRTVPSMKPVVA